MKGHVTIKLIIKNNKYFFIIIIFKNKNMRLKKRICINLFAN